jgi:hypothetical protein
MAEEMMKNAKELDQARRARTAYIPQAEEGEISGGNYLKQVRSKAYLDSEQNLQERLNSKQHYLRRHDSD